MIYVVGDQQDLHFKQFFKILELMGEQFVDRLEHVNFGRVNGMSTRKGEVKVSEVGALSCVVPYVALRVVFGRHPRRSQGGHAYSNGEESGKSECDKSSRGDK